MRIIHVRDLVYVGRNLVEALNRIGHECELYPFPESSEKNIWRKAIRVMGTLPIALRVNTYIRANRFDVVHLHVANSGWIAALGRYPYFVHCHGSEVRAGLYQPVRSLFVRYTLKHALHVFYVTPDLQEHVCNVRPDATLLPNPVDTDMFAPIATSEFRDRPIRVLIAAPLTVVKGPELAYEAIEIVRRDLVGVPIEVGAFSFGKDPNAYSHLMGISNIHYVSPRPHDQMADLYRDYDIVVGQTRIGCLSLVELESMACGKPVVCFCDLDAYARHYDQIPPVFSAETAEGMAEHIKRLVLDSACRHSAGQQARDWVVKYHGMETVARQLESQYRQHLSQSAC